MNTKSLTLAAVLSTFAFAAAAAGTTEASIGNEAVAQSVTSRAEVRAELVAAQRNGSFALASEAVTAPVAKAVSTATRAEVRKEAVAALTAARKKPLSADDIHVGG